MCVLTISIALTVQIMSYLVSGGDHFNLVLSHHDNTDPATWTRDQDEIVAAMKREYAGWDEVAVALVDAVKSTMKWPLARG